MVTMPTSMNVQNAKSVLASLCLGLQLLLGALPLAGVVLCVAPGHVALELLSGDCEGSGPPAGPSLARQCMHYGLAQSDAVPPDLRLPHPKRSAAAVSIGVPSPISAILPSQLRIASDRIPSRTPNLRSLRTVVLLV